MFFYNCKILNPIKLAPSWFTNVNVIETMPNPEVSGTGPLQVSSLTFDWKAQTIHVLCLTHYFSQRWKKVD